MTEKEVEDAEKDAREDAKQLSLMILLANSSLVQFESDTGRFRYDGRVVTVAQIRAYLQRIEKRMASRAAAMIDRVEAGRMSVGEFRRGFERIVRSSHILAGALALGSIAASVRNSDVQERIVSELQYADGLIADVQQAVDAQ